MFFFWTILPVPVFICEDFLLPFCRPSTSQGDRSWHSDTAEGGLLSWPIMALRCSALHGSCDGFARMIPMMVLIPSSLSIQFPSIHVLEKPFDPSWFLGDVTGESLEMVWEKLRHPWLCRLQKHHLWGWVWLQGAFFWKKRLYIDQLHI